MLLSFLLINQIPSYDNVCIFVFTYLLLFLFLFGVFFKAEEVFSFQMPVISNLLEQWSQSQTVKLVGLLACAYLVIPSAAAVDALKTCTCLLKECRYSIKLSEISL